MYDALILRHAASQLCAHWFPSVTATHASLSGHCALRSPVPKAFPSWDAQEGQPLSCWGVFAAPPRVLQPSREAGSCPRLEFPVEDAQLQPVIRGEEFTPPPPNSYLALRDIPTEEWDLEVAQEHKERWYFILSTASSLPS